MIKTLLNIFIPETFKGATLLPLRILSITFEENSITGTVILQKGTSYSVENIVKQEIDTNNSPRTNALILALKNLTKQIGNYDKIVTTISSSLVTFKELSLPFLDEEKIQMVLPFEIEGILPFDSFNACIDFIVTNKNIEEKNSAIMVGAIQKKYIQDLTNLFNQAGLEIDLITTDIISLYGLYSRSKYTKKGNTAFIELGNTESKIAFFIDGQLKFIRTLQQSFQEGKDNELFWKKIIFTLQSFKADTATESPLKNILLFGDLWKNLTMTAEEKLNAPCKLFNIKQFATETNLSFNKKVNSSDVNFSSLAAALSLPKNQSFSLREQQLTKKENTVLSQQIITSCFLAITLLGIALGHTFYTVYKLTAEKDQSEKEIIQVLKKNFPSMKKTSSLTTALDQANREVHKEENIWSSLSEQTRQSYLNYLSILSVNIEREVLGLNLKKLIINKNTITLEGSVRNFEAIDQLEQQLKATKLFVHVPDLQSIEFLIPLMLNNQGSIS